MSRHVSIFRLATRGASCACLALCLAFVTTARADPVRLAILSDEGDRASAEQIVAHVEVALTDVREITLIERAALEAILREQHLTLSGQVSPEKAIAIGKLAGVEYLLILAPQGKRLGVRLVQTRDAAVRLDEVLAIREDPFLSAAEVREKTLRSLQQSSEQTARLTVGVAAFANRSGTDRSDPFNAALQKLLRERLRAEPWAIVLERQYPSSLLAEADLSRMGLAQGSKEDLPPADLVVLGAFEDAVREFRADQPWQVKLEALIRLRGIAATVTMTCRSDQPDIAATQILGRIDELQKNPVVVKSALTEKEFWRSHALYLTPRSSYAVGRSVWDCYGPRERADTLEAVRAWENLLLLDDADLDARMNLGMALLSLYASPAMRGALPNAKPDARHGYAVQQALRGTRLVEQVIRAMPTQANATTFYFAANAGISHATSGDIYSYSRERTIEMNKYIAENPAVFPDYAVKYAKIYLRCLEPDRIVPAVEAAVALVEQDPVNASQLLQEFLHPDHRDAAARLPAALQYADNKNVLVRLHAERFLGRYYVRQKDRAALEHYDRAIELMEPAGDILKAASKERYIAEWLDDTYRMRVEACETLNLQDEALHTIRRGAQHFIQVQRFSHESARMMQLCITKAMAPEDAAEGVVICDGFLQLYERDNGMHSGSYSASMVVAAREVFQSRLQGRTLPDFSAMKRIPGTETTGLYAPTMAVAGGKLWLAWQPWQGNGVALVVDPAVGRAVNVPLPEGERMVRAVAAVGERVYFGTVKGLYELDTTGRVVRSFRKARNELPSDHIVSLCAGDGTLYLSFREFDRYGVAALNPKTGAVSVLAPTGRQATSDTEPVYDVYRLWWDAVNRRIVANDYFIYESEHSHYSGNIWMQTQTGWMPGKPLEPVVRYVVSQGTSALRWTLPLTRQEPGILEFIGTDEKIPCAIPLLDQVGEPAWDDRRIWLPGYMGLYEVERRTGKLRWLAYQKDTQCLAIVHFDGKLCIATTNGLYVCPKPD